MVKKAIKADTFHLADQEVSGGHLLIEDGRFKEWTNTAPSSDWELLDFSGAIVAPGLVDTHIHGRVGSDVMDSSSDALAAICKNLPQCGVTSWLATTLTEPTDALQKACASVAAYMDDQNSKASEGNLAEARIEGIFLEGPFFTEKHKGAQNPDFLCPPVFEKLKLWQEAAQGTIKKIALAPEYEEAPHFTQQAVNEGVVVGLAHTDATAQEALRCIDAGASVFVHTYNGMNGHNHRDPGVVSAALLTAGETYGEIICDGNHVHPIAVEILVRAKGTNHSVLISDCIRAGGLPDGPSKLGELDVIVENGEARLVEGGSLAGSTMSLMQAVKNVVSWSIASRDEALRMASSTAALANGIAQTCGSIAPERNADFIVVDNQLNLLKTFIGGTEVYSKA